jgi:hypothetical protein
VISATAPKARVSFRPMVQRVFMMLRGRVRRA